MQTNFKLIELVRSDWKSTLRNAANGKEQSDFIKKIQFIAWDRGNKFAFSLAADICAKLNSSASMYGERAFKLSEKQMNVVEKELEDLISRAVKCEKREWRDVKSEDTKIQEYVSLIATL